MNSSVTQYTPPRQMPGSKYTVTVQGLTAAGAGDASHLEFQAYVSGEGFCVKGLLGWCLSVHPVPYKIVSWPQSCGIASAPAQVCTSRAGPSLSLQKMVPYPA